MRVTSIGLSIFKRHAVHSRATCDGRGHVNGSSRLWLARLSTFQNGVRRSVFGLADHLPLLWVTAMLIAPQIQAQVTPSRNASPPADVGQFQIQQTDVTLLPGGKQQFLTMGLAPGVQVHWQVNGGEGGDGLVGRIDPVGWYQAPQTIPTVPVTITAFVSDFSSATANVTFAVPACTPPNGPCIRIAPNAVIPVGSTASLTVVPKTGQSSNAEWFVNGVQNGSADLGTISQSGPTVTYSAPRAVVPNVTIAAKVHTNGGYVTKSLSIILINEYVSVRCYGPDVKGAPKSNCRARDFNRLAGSTGTIDRQKVDDDAAGNEKVTPASWVTAINSSKALVSGSLLEITFPNGEIAGNCKNYDWKIVTQAKESPNILIYNPSDVGSGVCVDGKFLIALPVHVLWADVSGFQQFADPSRSAPAGPSTTTDCFGQPVSTSIVPCDRFANWRIGTLYKLANVQRLFGQSGAAQGTVSLSPVIGSGSRQLAFDIQADPAVWARVGWINVPVVFEKSTTAGSNLDSLITGIAFDTRWVKHPNLVEGYKHFKFRKPQFRVQTGVELAPTTPHDLNVVEYGTAKFPLIFTFHQQPSAFTVYPVIGIEGGSHAQTHLAEPDPILRGVVGVDGSFRWPYNVGHSFFGSSPITIDYSYRMRWLAYPEPTTNPAGTGTELLSAGRHAYGRVSFIVPYTANFQFQTTFQVGSLPPDFRVIGPTLTLGLTLTNPGSSEH